MGRGIAKWVMNLDSGDIPSPAGIDLTVWSENSAVKQAPAEWVHVLGGPGATVTIVDTVGNESTLTATEAVEVWTVSFKKILACSDSVELGTGTAPVSNRAVIHVTSPEDLETLDLDEVEDGTLARSKAPRALWQLIRDQELAAVEGVILVNGDHNWQRVQIPDAAYTRVTDWYVSSEGTWTASGTAEGESTTIPEIMRRLGNQVNAEVTVHVLDDITDDLDLVINGPMPPGSKLEFSGVLGRTTVTTGTVTAYTEAEPGVSRGELTASFSLATHVGKVVRVTGGDREGCQFIILKSTTGGKAEISVPQLTPYFGDPEVLQAGDPIAVETLPQLGGNIKVFGIGAVAFDNLSLGEDSPHSIWIGAQNMFMNSCII
jgi:hypothetical protein